MKTKLLLLLAIIVFTAISCAKVTDLDQLADSHVFMKKDYNSQIIEDFRLDIKGYSKTFDLNLKYFDTYSLGVTNGNIGFPEKYKFNGKLRLQFYYKNRVVRDEEVTKWHVAWDMTGNNGKRGYHKEITLAYFKFPLDHKYKDNVTLRVTVIEPDVQISEFGKELKIVIGVSATP